MSKYFALREQASPAQGIPCDSAPSVHACQPSGTHMNETDRVRAYSLVENRRKQQCNEETGRWEGTRPGGENSPP